MLSPRDNRQNLENDNSSDETFPVIIIDITDGSPGGKRLEMSVLDINDSGMGVSCDYPLSVGQTVNFIEEQLDWEVPSQGVVMWTFKENDGFQAGIKFI